MSNQRLAALDLGSNTIKVLLAEKGSTVVGVDEHTIEAGLARGMSQTPFGLTEDGMARGLDAVVKLVAWAGQRGATDFVLTATAAVRDSANGPAFAEKVFRACGHRIRILTGEEEARYVALGVQQDPALEGSKDFYLTDLGGGSMEFVDFHGGAIAQAVSLPIGSVRLAEVFLSERTGPVSPGQLALIDSHVRKLLRESGFRFGRNQPLVCTGGAANHARQARGKLLPPSPGGVTTAHLSELLRLLSPLTAKERLALLPEFSPTRAELIPVAAATLLAVMEESGLPDFVTSYHNLRWGVAAEWFAHNT